MRFAGIYLDRDGYTDNLYTGNGIDDRHQWSARAGFRLTPSENTDINLTLNYFKEMTVGAHHEASSVTAIRSAILGVCLTI